MRYFPRFCLLLLASNTGVNTFANEADVIDVKTRCHEECTFFVTVKHQDNGWEHYVNKWEVVGTDGKVIATRVLRHPHTHEQPFMRSLSHVIIPAGTTKVQVRAYDSLHGYGGKTVEVDVSKRTGQRGR